MLSDDLSALKDFNGIARLFPLPNLVLFPLVTQALHIFEPRYRQMTADALAGDRLIAMVLLQPGWEADYEGRPALYSVACLGKIAAEQRLPDGRYNIQLRGLTRARIEEEIENGKLYRSARLELLRDSAQPAAKTDALLPSQLAQVLPTWCQGQTSLLDVFGKLLKSNMPLGAISDIISFALPLAVEFKQELLENQNVEERARELLHYLETHSPPELPAANGQKFPPDFSQN